MSTPVIRHDFSAVNRFIDREFDRAHESLRFSRANRWMVWSQVWIKGAIAIATLFVAAGLIWWLFFMRDGGDLPINAARQDKFSEQQLAELSAQFQQLRREIGVMMTKNARDERETLERLESGTEQSSGQGQVSTAFTVFDTVAISDSEQIVTGRTYNPSDITVPESVYCYHGKSGERFDEMTQLADKPRGKPIIWRESLSSPLLALGREHCRFSDL